MDEMIKALIELVKTNDEVRSEIWNLARQCANLAVEG